MKKFLKAVLIASIAATLIVPAMAQQAGPNGGGLQGGQAGKKGQGRGGMMKVGQEVLAKVQPPLSKDQEKQISALKKKTMASMKDLRDKSQAAGADKTKLREDVKKIMEDHRKALMAILTPDQQKSYESLMKEALANAKKGKAGTGKSG